MGVSIFIVPKFRYYRPSRSEKLDALLAFTEVDSDNPLADPAWDTAEIINHLPVITVDECIWLHGTNYLLGKALDYDPPHSRTLVSIARDLRDFRVWVYDSEIDYLVCRTVPSSPLRRYKRFLISDRCSPSVISRKMSRLVSFYRWLADVEGVQFEKPVWRERDVKIFAKNQYGANYVLNKKTTDVQQVRQSRSSEGTGYDGLIRDGGLLRPFSPDEQRAILKALVDIGNTEMTLSFLLSLTTGARMQSIFTLRKCHFGSEENIDSSEIIIHAGPWPTYLKNAERSAIADAAKLIDTKGNRQNRIYIPTTVYELMISYLSSDRYINRCDRSDHFPDDPELQYVFLTTRGNPYYISRNDPSITRYLNPPYGASVQQFISQQLKPKLRENGFDGHFKFHNLRASYGMNLVRSLSKSDSNPNGIPPTELLGIIRDRLNHTSISTTQLYLSYDLKNEIIANSQASYEQYLASLIGGL